MRNHKNNDACGAENIDSNKIIIIILIIILLIIIKIIVITTIIITTIKTKIIRICTVKLRQFCNSFRAILQHVGHFCNIAQGIFATFRKLSFPQHDLVYEVSYISFKQQFTI